METYFLSMGLRLRALRVVQAWLSWKQYLQHPHKTPISEDMTPYYSVGPRKEIEPTGVGSLSQPFFCDMGTRVHPG
jgi:hypothetical protein